MNPNSALAAWQLAIMAVVPVAALAAWLSAIFLAARGATRACPGLGGLTRRRGRSGNALRV
jgi:hypothetical protein